MYSHIYTALALCLSACTSTPVFAETTDQPQAVGKVRWGRNLDSALASSKQTGKPVFALFQEVPGCAGCQQFGRDVLSNPTLVEAIENEFAPLLIHNNRPGKDAEVLQRFHEPAWNYQVIRFLNASGQDLIPRRDQVWETGPVAERMIAALHEAGKVVPNYLSLLASEHSTHLEQAAFAMYCFWTGEMALGQITGVVTTEAGFISGREVTLVTYDSAVLSLSDLIKAAEKVECANTVFLPPTVPNTSALSHLKIALLSGYQRAPASDQKKQLSGTGIDRLSLNAAQLTKLNSWLRTDPAKAQSFLPPSLQAKIR